MRLTRRGRLTVLTVATLAGLALGMTAQVWNPYTRSLDHCATVVYEDGSSATACAGHVVDVVHSADR